MLEAIRLETLNILFGDLQIGKKLKFKEIPCVSCSCPVSVEIEKTAAGYGFLKGILYEPDGARVPIQCSACTRK